MATITYSEQSDRDDYKVIGEREHIDAAVAEIGDDARRIEEIDGGIIIRGGPGAGGRIRKALSGYNRRQQNAAPSAQSAGRTWTSRRLVDYYQAKRAGLSCGKAFRASPEHPSTHGIAPDLVGEWVCYVYE